MSFSVVLNNYMELLNCSALELCSCVDLPQSTLSRYRTGKRIPAPYSDSFTKICSAIAIIAEKKGISDITLDSVTDAFLHCPDISALDKQDVCQCLQLLICTLNINVSKLCQAINYSPSTISRYRAGTRTPDNPQKFSLSVANYIAKNYTNPEDLEAISNLLDCDVNNLSTASSRSQAIYAFMIQDDSYKESVSVDSLLKKMDSFDLEDYIQAIRFNELKIPRMPFTLPLSKYYYGLEEFKNSELQFLKTTVLSKSDEPVILYSDMPISEISKDLEFSKKWMYGMAMMLKKGLHLYQIHHLDRSFHEMMLGLESFIPMYMTGQISPYYLKSDVSSVFHHMLKVSGSVSLSGEAINNHYSDGVYYLTTNDKELTYYKKRAKALLSAATPLMDIYDHKRKNELENFLFSHENKNNRRSNLYSTPPIYTISLDCLDKIFTHNNVDDNTKNQILRLRSLFLQQTKRILSTSKIHDDILLLSKEDFIKHPLKVACPGLFLPNQDIMYTYDTYKEHLSCTENFSKEHENYECSFNSNLIFRNINIKRCIGQYTMISKYNSPCIHFCIHHPKLLSAIEAFTPAYVDNK